MTVSRANNSEKQKKKKTKGNENFDGSDKHLSTKLTRQKHSKRRKLKNKN